MNNKYIRKIQPTHCEHESDGNTYLSHPPQYKCKKCGEFYPTLASYTGSSSNIKKFTDEELREYVQKIKQDTAQEKIQPTPSLSGRKEIKKIDIYKIRGSYEERQYTEQGTKVSSGDDTISSIKNVAYKVNEVIDILNTNNLSGRKAKLILDGTEHTVTFE